MLQTTNRQPKETRLDRHQNRAWWRLLAYFCRERVHYSHFATSSPDHWHAVTIKSLIFDETTLGWCCKTFLTFSDSNQGACLNTTTDNAHNTNVGLPNNQPPIEIPSANSTNTETNHTMLTHETHSNNPQSSHDAARNPVKREADRIMAPTPMPGVLAELVASQRTLANAQGVSIAHSDEERGSMLLIHYAKCPFCNSPLAFDHRSAMITCENQRQFIKLHGSALVTHFQANPGCEVSLLVNPAAGKLAVLERKTQTPPDVRCSG
jgi:hypothetical protein